MAARPLLLGLLATTRSRISSVPLHNAHRPFFRITVLKPATLTTSATSSSSPASSESRNVSSHLDEARYAAFLGEADSDDAFELGKLERGDTQEPIDPLVVRYAAFLGEADSDDNFQALRVGVGDTFVALDPSAVRNAAFLGEADSDDGFEARRAEEGDRHEAIDATNAAFLGEADSDDGFEAAFEVDPSKYAHRIEDTTESGFHAEGG
ncbi:hypothetical protein LTS15_010896 [Exophiala xenobiotica]|nr:hypothetical protein LTS15_010896 [Exophiala xenobiotica]